MFANNDSNKLCHFLSCSLCLLNTTCKVIVVVVVVVFQSFDGKCSTFTLKYIRN